MEFNTRAPGAFRSVHENDDELPKSEQAETKSAALVPASRAPTMRFMYSSLFLSQRTESHRSLSAAILTVQMGVASSTEKMKHLRSGSLLSNGVSIVCP